MPDARPHRPAANTPAVRPTVTRQKPSPGEKIVTLGIFVLLGGFLLGIGGIVLWVVVGGWAGFGLFSLCAVAGLFATMAGVFMMTTKP